MDERRSTIYHLISLVDHLPDPSSGRKTSQRDRLLAVANQAVWSYPVYNYTQHWGYLWDEITLPITYQSDWQRAAELILEHGQT